MRNWDPVRNAERPHYTVPAVVWVEAPSSNAGPIRLVLELTNETLFALISESLQFSLLQTGGDKSKKKKKKEAVCLII